jgi:NAD(P)-dependent dehydrogenase (short-subunit alcohol dehydrogenase family)
MQDFRGKLAVVTGAGSGIGRQLALQLTRAGAHVALCDQFMDSLAQTKAACDAVAAGTRVSAHGCDVSNELQVLAFRAEVLTQHATDHVDLLFNNAGTGGGASFILDSRATWDRTFGVCWYGVYYCTRAFLPLLIASREACLVNVSSINAMYAVGSDGPHTAYASAKFAVKGFSEALITDLRLNAPHVRVVLVMPGHVGTSIVTNTLRAQGYKQPKDMSAAELAALREWLEQRQSPHTADSDEQLRSSIQQRIDGFEERAPLSAAQAAAQILEAVEKKRWRVLIGEDASFLDTAARKHAEKLYEPGYLEGFWRERAAAS